MYENPFLFSLTPKRFPTRFIAIFAGTFLLVAGAQGDRPFDEPTSETTSETVNAATGDPPALRYFVPVERGEPKRLNYDVAVYGGTPAGVTAAVQSARMGKKTVLLSFNSYVGGLTSGGLTATDIGSNDAIGGIAREFYQRLGKLKDFSSAKAETTFHELLNEVGVTVLLVRPLESTHVEQARIQSIKMMTGETIAAKIFIDASYEGDLLAAAGVSYRVGREPRGAYDESLAGQWQTESWKGVYQFCGLPISPYVKPADPTSGLLPEIASKPAGQPGQGDYKVQAYNFRMALTNKKNKVPFPRPREYDAGRYALLARFLGFAPDIRWKLNYTTKPMTDGPVQMRNGDSNNAGSFSSDYIGGSYRWPDGTYQPGSFSQLPPPRRGMPLPLAKLYELREAIFQDHVNYQQGLMYFLANDPRVSVELQQRVNRFGLDPDEFKTTGHWPHQLYVREGRRMVSDYVMTQANCQSKRTAEDSIGLSSYSMDSHFCQRVVVQENGITTVRNEGGFGHRCPRPYPVSYRSIVPRKTDCQNLLVPVSLSASHVAFGSIRMEPDFMILGQSAGTAACLAIDEGVAVQDIAYRNLEKRLLADKQRLVLPTKLVTSLRAGKPQTIVAYGTSLTFDGAWVEQVESDLQTRFPELVTVVNSGGSGKWSNWGVEHLDEKVIEKNPDLVFLEFSINDSVARFGGSPEIAKSNLDNMVDRILRHNPQCEIVLLTMTPGNKYSVGHRSYRKNISAYYETYRTVAKERGFLIVDLEPVWRELQNEDEQKFLKYVPDTIHAKPIGCEKIITPAILTALGG
jgi:lysophospholipase L1-like esterase